MSNETIIKLLESKNIDDISLGIHYLYKMFEGDELNISAFLRGIKNHNKVDFYIGDLNIVAWGWDYSNSWTVYPNGSDIVKLNDSPIIRL